MTDSHVDTATYTDTHEQDVAMAAWAEAECKFRRSASAYKYTIEQLCVEFGVPVELVETVVGDCDSYSYLFEHVAWVLIDKERRTTLYSYFKMRLQRHLEKQQQQQHQRRPPPHAAQWGHRISDSIDE